MTADPSYALQKAVYETITAASVGATVYYTVPAGASLPWCVIGDDQILSDYESGDFSECYVTVHVHGKKPAFKTIAGKVREALDTFIVMDDFTVVEAWFDDTKYMTESDAQLGHAVLTFRYLVQANA